MFEREWLLRKLLDHYRSQGFRARVADGGTVCADGPGGVTWHGRVIVADDLRSGELETSLSDLAERRMGGDGPLCPLDLLPAEDCAAEVEALLKRLGLGERRHIAVYSFAAPAAAA
jgi:hypothetical protein